LYLGATLLLFKSCKSFSTVSKANFFSSFFTSKSKLNIGHQSFLFISDNIDTLKRIEETDVSNHKITLNKESQLFTKTYEELYKKYQRYLEKEFID